MFISIVMVSKTVQIEVLKTQIEKMNKFNHVEILRILKNNKIPINENKNGVFINLTEVDGNVIEKLQQYVEYVIKQQRQLSNIEKQKDDYETKFFGNTSIPDKDDGKDIKDNHIINSINA